MRTFYPGADGGVAAFLDFPVLPPNTWASFWLEVDRKTGAVSAAINGVEMPAPQTIEMPPNAEGALEPTLHLGAATTQPGCEARVDEVKISVR